MISVLLCEVVEIRTKAVYEKTCASAFRKLSACCWSFDEHWIIMTDMWRLAESFPPKKIFIPLHRERKLLIRRQKLKNLWNFSLNSIKAIDFSKEREFLLSKLDLNLSRLELWFRENDVHAELWWNAWEFAFIYRI